MKLSHPLVPSLPLLLASACQTPPQPPPSDDAGAAAVTRTASTAELTSTATAAKAESPLAPIEALLEAGNFGLQLDEEVFYVGSEEAVSLHMRTPRAGYIAVRELGVPEDASQVVPPQPAPASGELTLEVAIEPSPGRHQLELLAASREDMGDAVTIGKTQFDIRGPVWSQLEALVTPVGTTLEARATKDTYALHEKLKLSVASPGAGHLLVIGVGAEDEAAILYPNRFHPEGRTRAGTHPLPAPDAEYDFPALPPRGETLVLVAWSKRPLLRLGPRSFREAPMLALTPERLDALKAALAPDPRTRKYPQAKLSLIFTVVD